MALNLFEGIVGGIGHCAGIGLSFVVVAMVAVGIDAMLRRCKHWGVTPSLLVLLHLTAQSLVVLDAVLILAEAGGHTWQQVKPMVIALLTLVGWLG